MDETEVSVWVNGISLAGLESPEEVGAIQEATTMACQAQGVHYLSMQDLALVPPACAKVPGSTGRVLLLELRVETNKGKQILVSDEEVSDLKQAISEELDDLILNGEDTRITQPLLISIVQEKPNECDDSSLLQSYMESLVMEEVNLHEMAISLPIASARTHSLPPDDAFVPTQQYEVDGATISTSSTLSEQDSNKVWDTSSLLVFDNLISEELRKGLLDVVLGRANDSGNEGDSNYDINDGPDPARWHRGGLIDLPEEDNARSGGVGLSDDAIADICFEHHDAIEQAEMIISTLLDDFTVSRLSEAVLGSSVTPLTANAPCTGDIFHYHIDGDPFFAPPSPWTDVYGRYANRLAGKPRFMSCLVYLNDEWNYEEWGAPTRFLDVATETEMNIAPIPGRILLMDQDITHSVVAPKSAAGNRPRYSLVWKLILHPKKHDQDMTFASRRLPSSKNNKQRKVWPTPEFVGSAAGGI